LKYYITLNVKKKKKNQKGIQILVHYITMNLFFMLDQLHVVILQGYDIDNYAQEQVAPFFHFRKKMFD